MKFTKDQLARRELVLGWLHGDGPELTIEQVLSTYVPPHPARADQYFTPEVTARAAFALMPVLEMNYMPGCMEGIRVLEPAAGIGHLIWYMRNLIVGGAEIHAFELEEECYQIGCKLFARHPNVVWHLGDPFDLLDELEGQFDYVIANPPYKTKCGLATAQQITEAGFRHAYHLFLELAIRALKPGGETLFIAPWSFYESISRKQRQWLDEHAELMHDGGGKSGGRAWADPLKDPLPGHFELTGIQVHPFIFFRSLLYESMATGETEVISEVTAPEEFLRTETCHQQTLIHFNWPGPVTSAPPKKRHNRPKPVRAQVGPQPEQLSLL